MTDRASDGVGAATATAGGGAGRGGRRVRQAAGEVMRGAAQEVEPLPLYSLCHYSREFVIHRG
jgi:hypothetical protein